MRLPSWRGVGGLSALLVAGILASVLGSTMAYLRVPPPTGAFAVGKVERLLVDEGRPEPATSDPGDRRRLRLVVWYPAKAGTGEPPRYVTDLDAIGDGLIASGELGPLEVAGLRLVRDRARVGAALRTDRGAYPVVLLSPGNATNVEFYGSLSQELASHGFVVVGIDHPYQVAAVHLDGDVAVYGGDPPRSDAEEVVRARIDERLADIGFVLDRLEEDAAGIAAFAEQLDLSSIGVMGHSNGGIAAAHSCADPRIDACLNIDGQLAGGPFSSRVGPAAPVKPFMFLTKETELHPELARLFEEAGDGAYRVVVPAAEHDQFGDGALFRPRLTPIAGTPDDVMTVARGFTLAFFDHVLRGAPQEVFGTVEAPTDVQVFVYPLRRTGSG
ncbi:MAG TPA: hypothetical protein VHK06_07770 [Candidatus Limnocylindria bacterium]|nr:hypothetical protein [Candidatus Limnocylindria bacterium]